MKRKNVDCDLGPFNYSVKEIIDNAKKGNYIAVFKFNGVTLEAHPESYFDDIFKIYMLTR